MLKKSKPLESNGDSAHSGRNSHGSGFVLTQFSVKAFDPQQMSANAEQTLAQAGVVSAALQVVGTAANGRIALAKIPDVNPG
jgi:hypothetical protein